MPFVLNGGQATARAVTARWVVEHLNVIKHISPGGFPVRIDPALDAFSLEQLEKAFGNGIVMAVTSTTHTVRGCPWGGPGTRFPNYAGPLPSSSRPQRQ